MKKMTVLGVFVGNLCALGCGGGGESALEVSELSAREVESELSVKNALSASQSQTVLRLIDGICADTWCSGDYDFGFRRLSCVQAAGTCTLTLQVFPRELVATHSVSYWRSCKTRGFESFSSLVSTWPSGYQSLTEDYYDALSECTLRITAHLP